MKRREFLGVALAGGAALAGCGGGGGGGPGMMGPGVSTASGLPEGLPLGALSRLANTSTVAGQFSASVAAGPASVELVPGRGTALWLYNGRFPGPMIEAHEGDRVRIAFENRLAQDSTIHWHGLPVPADQDGNPMDPVAAGAARIYEFTLPAGSAGTYWYHPHPHRLTAEQVSRGLAAPFIVRAPDDPLAGLPEVTLFVTGARLDGNAQMGMSGPMDFMFGGQGGLLLVNGGRLPVHAVRPGATQRWRILNATSGRYLRLALDGHAFTLVGTDGGQLAAPVGPLAEMLVAPAQRVELVVTASTQPNARFTLRALRHVADNMGAGTYAAEDLLTLATTAEPPLAPIALPVTLRPMPPRQAPTAAKRLVLTQAGGMGMMGGAFLVNGRTFDMNRTDLVSTVGETEAWEIVNDTFMDHPMHIHGTQFRLVSRESRGQLTPAPYDAWLDTVDVPAGTTATIHVRHDLPGKRMVHCHILEHEDAGMMAVLDVRPR